MKFKFILFILAFSSCSQLQKNEKYPFLVDPNKLLEQIDSFIGWTTFENTFKCGTEISYDLNRCATKFEPYYKGQFCADKNRKVKIKIGNCTSESVEFLNGEEIWVRARKHRYLDYNFFRAWVGAPVEGDSEKPAEVMDKSFTELVKVENEKFKFKNGKSIPAIRIHVVYNHFNNITEKFTKSAQSIVLGKGSETAGALLEHKVNENKLLLSKVTQLKFPN